MKKMKKFLLALLLFTTLLTVTSCNQDNYDIMYDHMVQVWAMSLEGTTKDIAFYGDSRVIGADWVSAYPTKDVVNLGIGGDTVQNLIRRISLIETLEVKYCFLAIGGNDCCSDSFDAGTFRNQYNKLLCMLEDLGVTVYVNTVTGIRAPSNGIGKLKVKTSNNRIAMANAIIKELAANHGMTVIDIASVMDNSDGSLKSAYSTSDGVHFSNAGNQCWFDTLKPYVEGL